MSYNSILVSLLVTLAINTAIADEQDIKNNLSQQRLSLSVSLNAAQASITSCKEQNISVSASVVDSNGLLTLSLRGDGASPLSMILSQRKAYTAANFLKDTTQLADLSDTAVGRSEGILMSAGGVLIKVENVVYGAIGISGAATGGKDHECAQAGLLAVTDSLKSLVPKAVELTKELDQTK